MDVSLPPELMQVYRDEVADRAARLVAAARALSTGRLDQAELPDLVRDAHTIKGSSRMMGLPEMGNAAAVLERAWKEVEKGSAPQTDVFAVQLEQLAAYLPLGVEREPEGEVTELRQGIARLEAVLSGVSQPARVARRVVELPAGERGPTSLGGLLGEVERSVMTGTSRVETADLYRLINQAVEVSLDAEALADLSLVQFDGADPVRLMAAWRAQVQRLSRAVQDLQDAAVALADAPLRQATETFAQFVRYLGRKLGKDVRFEVVGDDLQFDRQIVELLREPLRHLLVNAVDHGLETPEERVSAGKSPTGVVRLTARREVERIVLSIADDGRGIDWTAVDEVARRRGLVTDDRDLTPFLFLPGFSTISSPHDFSGAGDGLATVAEVIERVNGGVRIETRSGEGTTVILTLPESLVLQNLLVVAVGDKFWGLPEAAVQASIPIGSAGVREEDGDLRISFQSFDIPLISMGEVMGMGEGAHEEEVVVLATRAGHVAVSVSEILGRRRVAVKALGPILLGGRHLTGAALLGGGEVMVVVDPNYLGEVARRAQATIGRRHRILVVDDSAGVRKLISATLAGRGFDVEVAPGAREAVLALAGGNFDALVVDYAMPRSNGVELVRALRAGGLQIPIVMVSGVAGPEDQAIAWQAGVNAYLDKFDLRQGALISTLRQLLERG
jgi:chemotaxis protein histidine kinase CheA